jgi:hypothetical protein
MLVSICCDAGGGDCPATVVPGLWDMPRRTNSISPAPSDSSDGSLAPAWSESSLSAKGALPCHAPLDDEASSSRSGRCSPQYGAAGGSSVGADDKSAEGHISTVGDEIQRQMSFFKSFVMSRPALGLLSTRWVGRPGPAQ